MSKQTTRNPHHLPTKICPVCRRSFTWRKKWERNWDSVRYCSDKCRFARQAKQADNSTDEMTTA